MTASRSKIPVGILGATGSVGQVLVRMLRDHPWFELSAVMASARSVGRPYGDAVAWAQPEPLDPRVARLEVLPCEPAGSGAGAADCPLVFSALGSSVARDVELAFAESGAFVVSNAASHRMHPRVPLIVPEVNASHLALLAEQSFGGGSSRGAIVTNPNCSTIGLVLALKPLVDAFGVEQVHVVTLQALSGAGRPGVPGLAALDNVIPFIPGEEEKLEIEPAKILGAVGAGGFEPLPIAVSAQCNRVPVRDGHTLCVSVGLGRRAEVQELVAAWNDFSVDPEVAALPSAPRRLIHVLDDPDGPQPALHRDLDGGMAVSIGRVRPCPLLDQRFVTLSHNTVRGAAGGSLLIAELARERGLLGGA